MNIPKRYKFVPLINSADINAGVDGDSINMAKALRAVIVLMFGAITGVGAILKIYSGATNGAKTSALTFKYGLGGAAVGSALADVLAATAESAALTLTAATYQNKMFVVEIDAAQMDLANNEFWLTVELDNGADSGICEAVALVEPRYSDKATLLA